MLIATLTWPEAFVGASAVIALALVLSVLIWSVFRTGQTAIRKDAGHRKLVEDLRKDVDRLRVQLQGSRPSG
jgi:hypothetical protein